MKMLIFSLLLPLLLGSCAPKVLTHIEKKYPSRVVADEVHLYGVGKPCRRRQSGSEVYEWWMAGHPPSVTTSRLWRWPNRRRRRVAEMLWH